jgi:hypothetical protein
MINCSRIIIKAVTGEKSAACGGHIGAWRYKSANRRSDFTNSFLCREAVSNASSVAKEVFKTTKG